MEVFMRRLGLVLALTLLAGFPLRAEQKNVKILTGLSDYELVRAMQLMRASLGVGCNYCHAPAADGKGLDFASDAKKEKETARKMISMVVAINAQNFNGHPAVSCHSCHRGAVEPVGILPLPQPLPAERKPEPAEKTAQAPPPTRDEVVAGYAAAIGKPSRASWESRRLTGTREGSDGKPLPMTIEEAPGMTHAVVKLDNDTMEQAATLTAGWSRNAKGVRPFGAPELAIFQSLADAFGPPLPESIPADARVFRRTEGGRDAFVVVFRPKPGTRERLEFDASSGLLLRRTILVDTPVGVAPTQADFDDWRDVGGVKYPMTIRVSPYDARFASVRHYTDVKFGAKIDEKSVELPK
jgi:photosynthetic reaction center cytochrome c subunit